MKRWELQGDERFITFSCFHQLPLLIHPKTRDRFVDHLAIETTQGELRLIAWVVMSDHVHLLVQSQGRADVGTMLRRLKGHFAMEVLTRWRKRDAPILQRLQTRSGRTKFWQAGGGHDRNIRDAELCAAIDYIHANPVEAGHCERETDWPWSSVFAYRGRVYVGPAIGQAV